MQLCLCPGEAFNAQTDLDVVSRSLLLRGVDPGNKRKHDLAVLLWPVEVCLTLKACERCSRATSYRRHAVRRSALSYNNVSEPCCESVSRASFTQDLVMRIMQSSRRFCSFLQSSYGTLARRILECNECRDPKQVGCLPDPDASN